MEIPIGWVINVGTQGLQLTLLAALLPAPRPGRGLRLLDQSTSHFPEGEC